MFLIPSSSIWAGKDPQRTTIVRVESARLVGKRSRIVGRNSHLGVHGQIVEEPVVRLATDSGINGWGHSRAKEPDASKIVGKNFWEIFDARTGTGKAFLVFDFPFWDLAGRLSGKPVYQLLGEHGPDLIPVYDGSIYFDDLEPETGIDRGIQPILDNVEWALESGFRAFKLKVGRGFKWMDKTQGLQRDIEVIRAVRSLAGPEIKVCIDSNIGYTLTEAKEVMSRVAEMDIYFLEEPFPERREDFVSFKRFVRQRGCGTLIALGENAPGHEARFIEFLRSGLVDVVQWDMRGYTLTKWLEFLPVVSETGAITAPHNWNSHLGGFYIAQFGRGCPYFNMGEIDSVEMLGVKSSGYRLVNGLMTVPDSPGFGLELDEDLFAQALREEGAWSVTL
jgi:L-alanine-DL-glutamate epimerase-like enolase superfamily enzyme